MKEILLEHMTDYSTDENFCFGIRCEECGKMRFSKKPRFAKAGEQPDTEGKKVVYSLLYQREWKQARDDACAWGKEVFNVCPVCHRLVCDSCFMICEDLDMCSRCARELEVAGTAVHAETGL